MKETIWKWMVFCWLLLGLAAGSVWLLYQEDLPAREAMEGLSFAPMPLAAVKDPVVAIGGDGPPVRGEDDFPTVFEWPDGVVPGELVMAFESRSDLERFIHEARRAGLRNLEVIPELGLVRIRTKNDDEAGRAWKLAGNAGVSFNPSVALPEVPQLDGVAGRLRPFGDQALAWMGVPDDNSTWGEGVRIAVLDTGVGSHPTLANAAITHMSMLDAEARLAGVGIHGTAVASLLVGQGEVRGIAPGAEVMSIQVLNGDGSGNGFDLARGIMAAVEGGAKIINLSLGTSTDSAFMRNAVDYAHERGVVIVASVGNEGAGRMLFPAAYEGVVRVGSVDGNGQHVPFSNRGEGLSVVAPGYGLEAAGPDGTVIMIDGTSFSNPYVAGSLAHLLSQGLSPLESIQVLQSNANEAGPPGADGYYGHGILNLERVESRNKPGIYDVALADHYLDLSQGVPQILISVENRGTEAVGNISLEVLVNGKSQQIAVGTLTAGDAVAGRVSLADYHNSSEPIEILSRVLVPGMVDARPDNDLKGSLILLNP